MLVGLLLLLQTAPAWSATAGTIDRTGHYVAPSRAGNASITLKWSGFTATGFAAIADATVAVGIPFGASQLWDDLGTAGTESYTLAHDAVKPGTIIQRIADARAKRVRLLFNMTGGHDPYMSVIRDTSRFDMAKWRDSMSRYDTPAIKAAVAAGVADGTIVGNSVMDEPHVYGLGDGNSWGPRGEMTKARVDSLCAYVKSIFPTMPVGVVHQHSIFEPDKSYRVCEFLVDQYTGRLGTPEQFRNEALALANRDHMAIIFGFNALNGGPQDRDSVWDCKDQGGYLGQNKPNCQVSPTQFQTWGVLLGVAGCAFRSWRHDATRFTDPAYRTAFAAVQLRLGATQAPARGCGRPL